jgi:hypothetical protein
VETIPGTDVGGCLDSGMKENATGDERVQGGLQAIHSSVICGHFTAVALMAQNGVYSIAYTVLFMSWLTS